MMAARTVVDRAALAVQTAAQLRAQLSALGLPQTGRKAELVERLCSQGGGHLHLPLRVAVQLKVLLKRRRVRAHARAQLLRARTHRSPATFIGLPIGLVVASLVAWLAAVCLAARTPHDQQRDLSLKLVAALPTAGVIASTRPCVPNAQGVTSWLTTLLLLPILVGQKGAGLGLGRQVLSLLPLTATVEQWQVASGADDTAVATVWLGCTAALAALCSLLAWRVLIVHLPPRVLDATTYASEPPIDLDDPALSARLRTGDVILQSGFGAVVSATLPTHIHAAVSVHCSAVQICRTA